jgi:hypothetical protein
MGVTAPRRSYTIGGCRGGDCRMNCAGAEIELSLCGAHLRRYRRRRPQQGEPTSSRIEWTSC